MFNFDAPIVVFYILIFKINEDTKQSSINLFTFLYDLISPRVYFLVPASYFNVYLEHAHRCLSPPPTHVLEYSVVTGVDHMPIS